MKHQQLYCSLDIETTGFDPLTEEILEVGFVFFTFSQRGLKITEEWTQVFKPNKAPSAQILGLTGITTLELDQAPKFSEHRQYLQDKLGSAVILGHNIAFDTKFLEAFGLKLSGKVIDTLDLAQWVLPTHHSYNLENLMHTFGISHKEAHRALADSKAALKLLEKLLQVYSSFPDRLKATLKFLAEQADFAFAPFLDLKLELLPFYDGQVVRPSKKRTLPPTKISLGKNQYINFPLGCNYLEVLAQSATEPVLLVVSKAIDVLQMKQSGLAEEAIFLPENIFNEKRFSKWMAEKFHTAEETKFLMKVAVWQCLNWQRQTILDLNLSFFGGQFKNKINDGKIILPKGQKVAVCDMRTFFQLAKRKSLTKRLVLICGLNEFEEALSLDLGGRVSWGYLTFLLKSFYNPDAGIVQDRFKSVVERGLMASDLFFGLILALLQTTPPVFLNIKITEEFLNDVRYKKVAQAAESFLTALQQVNLQLESKDLEKFILDLKQFFEPVPNMVKWIELSEKSCALVNMPLEIAPIVTSILSSYKKVSLVDILDKVLLPNFFLRRLGLSHFSLVEAEVVLFKPLLGQGDLFSTIWNSFKKQPKINIKINSSASDFGYLQKILKNKSILPAALLLPSGGQVKEFYELCYNQLKQLGPVLVQSQSGGSNKIFRNFSINSKSLLIATDKYVLNSMKPKNESRIVDNLPIKTLILCRLPFEIFTHPYAEALSASLNKPFEEFSLPKALYNLHRLIRFFYSEQLQDLYLIDSKLNKPYSKVFLDYLYSLPNANIS